MKFKYIGEAPEGKITQHDVVFLPNEWTEVKDEFAINKLRGNRFFVAADAKEKPKKEGE
jgi:hypothetical protein